MIKRRKIQVKTTTGKLWKHLINNTIVPNYVLKRSLERHCSGISQKICCERNNLTKDEIELLLSNLDENRDKISIDSTLNRLHHSALKGLIDSYYDGEVKLKPVLKNEIIDWISCKLFNTESMVQKITKRNMEVNDLDNGYSSLYFEFFNGSRIIPKEIIMEILSNFEYIIVSCTPQRFVANKEVINVMNLCGLLNSKWYLATLEAYGRYTKNLCYLNVNNVYAVPALVLKHMSKVCLDMTKLYAKDAKYLFKVFNRVEELTIKNNHSSFFYSGTRGSRACLPECHKLTISPHKQFKLPDKKILPKLKTLILKRHVVQVKKSNNNDKITSLFVNVHNGLLKYDLSQYTAFRNVKKLSLRILNEKNLNFEDLSLFKIVSFDIYFMNSQKTFKNFLSLTPKMENLSRFICSFHPISDSWTKYNLIKLPQFLCEKFFNLKYFGMSSNLEASPDFKKRNFYQKLQGLSKLEKISMSLLSYYQSWQFTGENKLNGLNFSNFKMLKEFNLFLKAYTRESLKTNYFDHENFIIRKDQKLIAKVSTWNKINQAYLVKDYEWIILKKETLFRAKRAIGIKENLRVI